VDDDAEIPTRLALPSFARLIRIERLRLANEQPLALEVCYLPAAQFAGLMNAPLERRSLFHLMERDYGLKLAYADEEVDATSADPRSAELLNVPRGAPLLRIRQVLFCDAGRPVAYSLALYRGDHHSLVIRRFR
jgi:GntR family transcriptional regulator